MIIDIALLIAVVIALTEVVKNTTKVSIRYVPLISLILGVISGVLYLDGDLKETVLYGIIVGLSASGLFDQSKIITKGDK